MNYKTLVLDLLGKKKYPILEDYVVLDIYYKMIPVDYPSSSVLFYDRRHDNPRDVFTSSMKPFAIHFMVCFGDHTYSLHQVDSTLDIESFPMQCITLKINRSYIDNFITFRKSETFEEEIYSFLAVLNYDVPRLANTLNINFFASTRFLPQRINLWCFKYTPQDIVYRPLSQDEQSCFGPQTTFTEIFPVRPVIGRLSECKSRTCLLSLNSNVEFPHLKYTQHFLVDHKTCIPLAFNPFENPIIV